MGFTKLDERILQSSIMAEKAEVFKVWIALLASCRQNGIADVSSTFLAAACHLPQKTVDNAIEVLSSPDSHSRSLADDGRRIKRVDGGYFVINYDKYRAFSVVGDPDSPGAKRTKRWREKRHGDARDACDVTSASSSLYSSVIKFLNLRTGKNFSTKPTAAGKHLLTRIKEGRTLDEFKYVIEVKASQWLNKPDMEGYLRPETLFGSKMESYLNERVIVSAEDMEKRVGSGPDQSDDERKRAADLKRRRDEVARRIHAKYDDLIDKAKGADLARLRETANMELETELHAIEAGA